MIGSLLIRPRVWYVIFQHCFSVYALICIYAGRELFTGKSVRSAKQRPEELAGPNMPTWLLQETQRVGLGFCSAVFGIGACLVVYEKWIYLLRDVKWNKRLETLLVQYVLMEYSYVSMEAGLHRLWSRDGHLSHYGFWRRFKK